MKSTTSSACFMKTKPRETTIVFLRSYSAPKRGMTTTTIPAWLRDMRSESTIGPTSPIPSPSTVRGVSASCATERTFPPWNPSTSPLFGSKTSAALMLCDCSTISLNFTRWRSAPPIGMAKRGCSNVKSSCCSGALAWPDW